MIDKRMNDIEYVDDDRLLYLYKDIIEYKKDSKKQDKIDVSKEKKRQEFLKKLRERY
jgi:hypothetical protein